jgi:hypothetical protein
MTPRAILLLALALWLLLALAFCVTPAGAKLGY